jgi:hypothetical protein
MLHTMTWVEVLSLNIQLIRLLSSSLLFILYPNGEYVDTWFVCAEIFTLTFDLYRH